MAGRQRGDARDLRPSRRRRAIDARFNWTPAPRCARVPPQRLAAVTGRHVPHLERVVQTGHDAVVREGGDAFDLRPSWRRTERSTARFEETPAPRCVRVPSQRPEAQTARRVPDLERVVPRPGHDAGVRQGGDAIDLRPSRRRRTIDARFDWTPGPRAARVPGQRPEARTARHVPHLERVVGPPRPGHEAAVRQDDDAIDLLP